MLHIVPTPVGNLEDITLRAIRVLKEADLILAEDTRTSAVLLRHYDIRTPMRAHHRNNEHAAVEGIVADLEAAGRLVKVEDLDHSVGHCYRCWSAMPAHRPFPIRDSCLSEPRATPAWRLNVFQAPLRSCPLSSAAGSLATDLSSRDSFL